MPIRSMTGFAQVKGHLNDNLAFSLSIKSVNHRFLDLHFRLPANSDALEMNLRRVLNEKLARGHIDVNLSLEQAGAAPFALNRQLVSAYVQAFRAAAAETGIAAEPDLNAVLRLPGVLDSVTAPAEEELAPAVLAKLDEVGKKLDFLLQEMNREANTLLSKTSGLSGDAVRITEAGLAMKADIEKAREQVQNIE